MIYYLVPAADDQVQDYLAAQGRAVAGRFRVVHFEDLRATAAVPPGVYVFSGLERLAPRVRDRAIAIGRRIAATPGARPLNDPARQLGRFDLIQALWRAGHNSFRAARALDDAAGLRFPVFLRDERSHDGALSPLIPSADGLNVWIGRAILLGVRPRDLIAVEFCETIGADGLYRKYGAFVVGNRILARGLECGPSWMLKRAGTRFSREMALEEETYVRDNPHRGALAERCRIAGVEYGRIDYSIRDGRIEMWEINTNPTIGQHRRPRLHLPADIESIRARTKAHFYDAFAAAWRDLDPAGDARVLPAANRARPWRRTIVPRLRRERWRDHLRVALRPIRPLVGPMLGPLFAGVGHLARRSAARRPRAIET